MQEVKKKKQKGVNKMRKLTKKQKIYIRQCIANGIDLKAKRFEILMQLEKMNDYETLYQDYDRLTDDLLFSDDKVKTIENFE